MTSLQQIRLLQWHNNFLLKIFLPSAVNMVALGFQVSYVNT